MFILASFDRMLESTFSIVTVYANRNLEKRGYNNMTCLVAMSQLHFIQNPLRGSTILSPISRPQVPAVYHPIDG